MILAAKNGCKDVAELLLTQDGIDINMKGILKPKELMVFKPNFFYVIIKKKIEWFMMFYFDYLMQQLWFGLQYMTKRKLSSYY